MDLQKLNTKQNAKKIRIVSMLLGLVAILVIGLSAIAPIISVYIPGSTDPEFTYATGQAFLGWQVTFYYYGPSIPIADRAAFLTNPVMIAAMVGTVIVLIVTTLMMRRGSRKKKGILEVISVLALLFSAIVYLCACPILLNTAGNMTKDAIVEANQNGGYTLGWYSIFLGIICILIALAKCASAAFFLFMKRQSEQSESKGQ